MTSRGRVGSGVLALGLLLIYLLTASSTPSVDASSASLQGWRIATTGSPWLDDLDLDELPVQYTDPPFWTGENASGHLVVYRSPGVTAASTLAGVANTIRAKIGWEYGEDDYDFLNAYYAALSARLERGMLFGNRRMSKYDE